MDSITRVRTLVLNAGYEPLAIVSFKRAIVLLMNDKATVISADDDDRIRSSRQSWPRPTVIILRHYVRLPRGRDVPVSRRAVLRRDGHRCVYCTAAAATVDHVLPRSRGGVDSWENLVACCLRCNNTKGDRTPLEMGWQMRVNPRAPHGAHWLVAGLERAQPDWLEFLAPAA